jgi:hypothetical protein
MTYNAIRRQRPHPLQERLNLPDRRWIAATMGGEHNAVFLRTGNRRGASNGGRIRAHVGGSI